MKVLGISALLGALAVTGCTGSVASQGSGVPASPPSANGVQAVALSLFGSAPDKRQGCGVTLRYVIKASGGAFPVPACSGWGGTIGYPNGNHRYIFGVTGSVTNDFGAPPPPSGTAIFYMHTNKVQPRNPPVFGNTGVTDTVTSSQLMSSHTYTLIVYGFIFDSQCPQPSVSVELESSNRR